MIILVAAVCIAVGNYYTKTQQSNNKHTESEKQTPQSQTKQKGSVKASKENMEDKITNKLDAAIMKELKKADGLLEKGKLEDALRRFVV